MSLGWKQWTKNDILYGIVAPVVVILLIVLVSQLDNLIGDGGFGVITGITMQLEELLLITVIPLLLGLVWNQWAGGASGFIMGSLYALYWADSYRFPGAGFGANTVLLGYVLSPILIGYMAGSMNKKSDNFRRMLISGIVSTTIGGIMLFGIFHLSPINVVTGVDGFLLTVLTRTACGAIIPIFAKVFSWYGISP
ncbi:MAG: hypothetical protein IAX21_04390 [Candidatus Bathyarchaeota archaeon]|nr:MAG: hypothetical protein NUK63_01390 [Candidatus Bathyarchaeum tardum]WNZ30097.1 MAG: hypothetical protein IAX21_04390 [Candidatus Bathyarchaeota archaeon]